MKMKNSFDLVIPLLANGKGSKWDDSNELKYSLRSIEKYCDLVRNVFIIGYKPQWITNVVHIPFEDTHIKAGLKDLNILEKILVATQNEKISEDFIFTNDDIFLLEPMFELPNYFEDTLSEYLKENQYLNAAYKSTIVRTNQYLIFKNKSNKHFDIHTPIIYNKQKFFDIFNNTRESLGIKSFYANHEKGVEVYLKDNKIKKSYTFAEIEKINKNQPFFSINDKALSVDMMNYITRLYPNKSKYEL